MQRLGIDVNLWGCTLKFLDDMNGSIVYLYQMVKIILNTSMLRGPYKKLSLKVMDFCNNVVRKCQFSQKNPRECQLPVVSY